MANLRITVLDSPATCSVDQLVDASGHSIEETLVLIDNGVLVPVDSMADSPMFHLQYVVIANTARRLRDDFELDGHGLSLALTLLRRIDEAEAELTTLRALGTLDTGAKLVAGYKSRPCR